MKKKLTAILLLTLLLTLTACGDKSKNTKRFDYLPLVKNMKLEQYDKPIEDKKGTAIYIVKNTSLKEVMNDYYNKLKEDNWEITEDERPTLLTAKKEDHEVIILSSQEDKDVKLTIVSK